MQYGRFIVHAAAVVGLVASMAVPASAHGMGGNAKADVGLGWHLGAFAQEWAKELGAFRQRTKALKQKVDTRFTKEASTTANPTCVRNATEKRENALLASQDTLNVSLRNALLARKSALLNVWGSVLVGDRAVSLSAAWDAYDTSVRNADTTYRTQQATAWTAFRADIAACPTAN